jgi:hypothetical protein
MKLIGRHRNDRQARAPRISITPEEIRADLLYPASRRPVDRAIAARRELTR